MDGRRRQKWRGEGRQSGPVVVQTPAGSAAAESQMNAGCNREGSGLRFVSFYFFQLGPKRRRFGPNQYFFFHPLHPALGGATPPPPP